MNHSKRHVPPYLEQSVNLGEYSWLLLRWVWGAGRAHLSLPSVLGQQPVSSGQCVHPESFQQRCEWGGCAGAGHWCTWSNVRVFSVHGCPLALVEAYVSYLGSWYQQKLIDYPFIDLRLFERCMQRTASNVVGTLDPYSMTDFIVNRRKGVESRDCMASRPALKKAIITSSRGMQELVEVVANIVGVWPLIVSYLKEIRQKDDGDSLGVRSSSFDFITTIAYPCKLFLWSLEEGDGWVLLSGAARSPEVVANIVGVWPLIVSYLKEIRQKDDGDSLGVRSSSFDFITTIAYPCKLFLWSLEEGDGWVLLSGAARSPEVPSFPHAAWNI